MAENISAQILAQCQELSLTDDILQQLGLLNGLVSESYDYLRENPAHILQLLSALEAQAVLIPNSFKVRTSRSLWNCHRSLRGGTQVVFFQSTGKSDDDTLMAPGTSLALLADSLFAELHREGGYFQFEWEPFGAKLLTDKLPPPAIEDIEA